MPSAFSPQELSCPGHTSDIFNPSLFATLVDRTVTRIRELQKVYPQIDSLAACGHSGLMLMGAVSYLTGLPQIAVRKTKDTHHDSRMVNGWMGARAYVILDDLVSSGSTIDKIIKEIEAEYRRAGAGAPETFYDLGGPPRPVAILLYQDSTVRRGCCVQGKYEIVPQYDSNQPILKPLESDGWVSCTTMGREVKPHERLPDIDDDVTPSPYVRSTTASIFSGQDLNVLFGKVRPEEVRGGTEKFLDTLSAEESRFRQWAGKF